MSYFQDVQTGIRSTLKGLSLTLRHLVSATKRRTPEGVADANYFDLQNGLVTLQYPHEQLPIPDNGRYRLRNEIDDCIVCDKCAKVCPVDCITIDAIKATEEVGRASDGSPIRLYAARFDIDMAKCCYCGLCTVVCPTECLTMDKKFDYSEFDLGKLTYEFSNLSPEQANEKRSLYEEFLKEKEAAKAAQAAAKTAATASEVSTTPASTAPKRPVFRPMAKPTTKAPAETADSEKAALDNPLTDATPTEMQQIAQGGLEAARQPVFEPAPELVTRVTDVPDEEVVDKGIESEKPIITKKPAFRPTMKPASTEAKLPGEGEPKPAATKPGGFKPTMKPPVKQSDGASDGPEQSEPPKAKPAFRPTMKPSVPKPVDPKADASDLSEEPPTPKPKPAFRPTMKPVVKPSDGSQANQKTNE